MYGNFRNSLRLGGQVCMSWLKSFWLLAFWSIIVQEGIKHGDNFDAYAFYIPHNLLLTDILHYFKTYTLDVRVKPLFNTKGTGYRVCDDVSLHSKTLVVMFATFIVLRLCLIYRLIYQNIMVNRRSIWKGRSWGMGNATYEDNAFSCLCWKTFIQLYLGKRHSALRPMFCSDNYSSFR